jgi:hypothetical protein
MDINSGEIIHNRRSTEVQASAELQVVEYLAYTLLTSGDNDEELKKYLQTYDFYLFPIANPDGQQFLYCVMLTFTKLTQSIRICIYQNDRQVVAKESPSGEFYQLVRWH